MSPLANSSRNSSGTSSALSPEASAAATRRRKNVSDSSAVSRSTVCIAKPACTSTKSPGATSSGISIRLASRRAPQTSTTAVKPSVETMREGMARHMRVIVI